MTKRRRTRRALINSIISLIICFSMLLGTTFAWFTDSVESTRNIIVAGNLDVELYNGLDRNAPKVNEDTDLFGDIKKWEPGVVAYENLTVANEGTLALKYDLAVNFTDATVSPINGKTLASVLKVAVIEDGANYSNDTAGREALLASIDNDEWMEMKDFHKEGMILPKDYKGDDVEDAADETETYGLVIYWEPGADDNDYNMNNEYQGKYEMSINLGVYLVATQLEAEDDSFGPDYDEDATYVEPWDGEADEPLEVEADNLYHIKDSGDLAAFAEMVNGSPISRTTPNNFSGKTVVLDADINLGNQPWTPIGPNADAANKFCGTFDGQGHTIYNLNVDLEAGYHAAGLFGALNGTVKNLKIDGATINSISAGNLTDNGIAVVAGSIYTKGAIDNVHVTDAEVNGNRYVGGISGYTYGSVTNSSVTNTTLTAIPNEIDGGYDNGDKVGGIAGYFVYEGLYKLSGNTVYNVTIKGYRDLGGVAGAANLGDAKNNTVEDVTIIVDQETNSYGAKDKNAAAIVGRVLTGTIDASNTSKNVTIFEGKMAAAGVIEKAANDYEVISKEGLLNVNDIIASTTTGEGRGIKVKLMTDVDLSGETWKPIDTMWVDFDGNGHTISNLTAEAWKAGFFGYLGGGSIKNLTLENVNVTGSQAGTFAGAIEGTIKDCTLKGNNTVTWEEKHQYDDPNEAVEAWSGIGAITGITQPCTVNATIDKEATVTLNYGAITTEAPYVDQLTGYIGTNKGTVTNNGTITSFRTATSEECFNVALEAGQNVTLDSAVTINASNTSVNSGYGATGVQVDGGTLNGNGNTLKVDNANGTWDCAVNMLSGTVKNLAISGAMRGIFMSGATGDVYIDNVEFKDVVYTFNSDAGNKEYGVYISNSTLNGWTSFSDVHKEVVFTNCKFGEGSGYAYCRPYNAASFVNCDFAAGFVMDARAAVTFDNCTIGGVALTAENIGTLVNKLENATVK